MCFLYVDSCTDNCLGLHNCDLRIGNCQTKSTVTHHRVELMQGSDDVLDSLNRFALSLSQFLDVIFLSRNKLMQRRIQETDRNRVALQSLEQTFEVALLIRKDLIQSCFSLFYGVSTDHLTESSDSVFLEEHMLSTAKTDTFCAKLSSFLRICRCISVGTNFQSSELVSPCHNATECTSDGSVYGLDLALVNITGCTINGDEVSLIELFTS